MSERVVKLKWRSVLQIIQMGSIRLVRGDNRHAQEPSLVFPSGRRKFFLLENSLGLQGVLLARTYGLWQGPCSIFSSDKEDQS